MEFERRVYAHPKVSGMWFFEMKRPGAVGPAWSGSASTYVEAIDNSTDLARRYMEELERERVAIDTEWNVFHIE